MDVETACRTCGVPFDEEEESATTPGLCNFCVRYEPEATTGGPTADSNNANRIPRARSPIDDGVFNIVMLLEP